MRSEEENSLLWFDSGLSVSRGTPRTFRPCDGVDVSWDPGSPGERVGCVRISVVLCLQGGGCARDPGPHEDLKHLPGCAAWSSQPLPTLPTTHPDWGLGDEIQAPVSFSAQGGGG